jgi:hypothetical protein
VTDVAWRDDPAWRLVEYDAGYWAASAASPPARPPHEAELAQPPVWASLYARWNGKLAAVATWYRPAGQ